MSQYGLVITNAGIALQHKIQVGDTLTFTRMAIGDGVLAGDPKEQTTIINPVQTTGIGAISVVNQNATLRADFSNQGLANGYYMREIGLWAVDIDNPGQEALYAYGNAGDLADYMPAAQGGDVTTIIQEVVVAIGAAAAVTALVNLDAVYVTESQWITHVGVGGKGQHPNVTGAVSGFMSSADKSKLDSHVGAGGASQHPNATSGTSGFMASADKSKLDGHVGVGGTSQHPVASAGAAGFMASADKVKLDSHVGVGGTSQHPAASAATTGFMSSADKAKLDKLTPGGWRAHIKIGLDTVDDDAYLASPISGAKFYHCMSQAGELAYSGTHTGTYTIRFRQRITASSATTLTVPILMNNHHAALFARKLFGDQALLTGGSIEAGSGYNRNLVVSLPAAGDYLIVILVGASDLNPCNVTIREWYNSSIVWTDWA